jgi:hypothetical protein
VSPVGPGRRRRTKLEPRRRPFAARWRVGKKECHRRPICSPGRSFFLLGRTGCGLFLSSSVCASRPAHRQPRGGRLAWLSRAWTSAHSLWQARRSSGDSFAANRAVGGRKPNLGRRWHARRQQLPLHRGDPFTASSGEERKK